MHSHSYTFLVCFLKTLDYFTLFFFKKSLYYKELEDERHHSVRLTVIQTSTCQDSKTMHLDEHLVRTVILEVWSFSALDFTLSITFLCISPPQRKNQPHPNSWQCKTRKKESVLFFQWLMRHLPYEILPVPVFLTYTHLFVYMYTLESIYKAFVYMHILKSIYEAEHVFFLRLGVLV